MGRRQITIKIEDVKALKPIVDNTTKTLYGEGVENIKIVKADQFPIFGDKEWWRVEVEFDDDKFRYSVSMRVRIEDGVVANADQMGRRTKQAT